MSLLDVQRENAQRIRNWWDERIEALIPHLNEGHASEWGDNSSTIPALEDEMENVRYDPCWTLDRFRLDVPDMATENGDPVCFAHVTPPVKRFS